VLLRQHECFHPDKVLALYIDECDPQEIEDLPCVSVVLVVPSVFCFAFQLPLLLLRQLPLLLLRQQR
jgi:hypothetical protein